MSRVGKQAIAIPAGVTVIAVIGDSGTTVTVKGPRGELQRLFRSNIVITVGEDKVTLAPKNPETEGALWGTYASHIKNMVAGVVSGFTKQLAIEGIGYKGNVAGQTLTLNVGFSHPVMITVNGPSKETVGQFAASVRAIKPPDPYKEKGIRYSDEKITRKPGKKVVS